MTIVIEADVHGGGNVHCSISSTACLCSLLVQLNVIRQHHNYFSESPSTAGYRRIKRIVMALLRPIIGVVYFVESGVYLLACGK